MDHILVAEDDKEIRQGIEIYLKSPGLSGVSGSRRD